MQKKLIKVHPSDNVAVALVNLSAGDVVTFEDQLINIITDVKAKHKISLTKFNEGDRIMMYGVLVGKANGIIEKGELLTTSNVKHQSEKVYKKTGDIGWNVPNIDKWKDRTFLGYERGDGQVGTENVWLFFPLVFCENRNVELLKTVFEREFYPDTLSEHQHFLRTLIQG